MPLLNLVGSMPATSQSSDLPAFGGSHFQIIPDESTDYVWPDLTRDGYSPDGPNALVLITAPGAMGKSAAARAIASRTGMPYVDLAKVRVGSGSLTGELSKSVGPDAYSGFIKDLRSGRAALVLDSIDEAQLTCGRENYLAFLEDLAWLLEGAEPHHQIVMLGRRDATDTTLIALEELGITPSVHQVAPLSHAQACELITLTLDHKTSRVGGPFIAHRQHPQPFGAYRDALFSDLASALEPTIDTSEPAYWDQVSGFLGYPPVVAALAERLATDDNPRAALEELKATPRSGRPQLRGVLLRTVLERVMERESGKVRDRVGEALALRPADPVRNALYTHDEQANRLLLLDGTRGLQVEHPAVLDEEDKGTYERLISSFVLDHPFVDKGRFANVVFSDYIRAWAISSTLGQVYTQSRAAFFSTLPKAGPFFTHFLHAMSTDAVTGFAAIPEDVVDDAIHSYMMGAESGACVYYQENELAVLGFHEEREILEDGLPALRFTISELSGVLVLTSPISRLVCVTDYGVLLRGVAGNIDIGPGVSVVAGSLEVDAITFNSIGSKTDSAERWNLISASEAEHSADLVVNVRPPSRLAVSWDNPWHQWSSYTTDFAPDRRLPRRVSSQVLLCMRRVLTSFKSSVRDDPSVSADKMDRVIVGSNEVFVATFEALVGLAIVSREGNLYRVHLDRLAEFEVSWATLRGDDPVEALKGLLKAVADRPELERFKQKQ